MPYGLLARRGLGLRGIKGGVARQAPVLVEVATRAKASEAEQELPVGLLHALVVDDVVGQHVGQGERAPGAQGPDPLDDDDVAVGPPRVRTDESRAELAVRALGGREA